MTVNHEALKQKLESRREKLQARLSSIKRDAAQSHSSDSGEQAQERENDEVLDAIGNETRLSIEIIEAALERIANGTYGTCASCSGAIGADRLNAIPEATLCLECAQ